MKSPTTVKMAPLRKLRLSKGVSQAWIAQELGVHRKTYENYELGRSTPPKAVLFLVAHLLHVSPNELIENETE